MVNRLLSVDSGSLQFPTDVRETIAANLADASTLEGLALASAKTYADAASAANLRALVSKLDRGVSNAGILVVSDSTGNQTNEWPYLVAQYLADKYPAYTVVARFWDEVGEVAYSSPVTVQTGSGAYTLSVWIAAKAGSVPGYFLGSRFAAAVADIGTPDVVFINHGHNTGDPTTALATNGNTRNTLLSLTETVAVTHPSAGIVLIAQNPTSVAGRETWQALKANVLDEIAGYRGYGVLDVHQAFIDYGDWETDLTNVDGIHPLPAGSLLWASVVEDALADARAALPARIETTPLLMNAKNYLSNFDFSSWAATDPDSWTPNSSATTSKDTTNYETGSQACKVTGNGTSGAAQLEQALGASKARELRGKLVTLAVRVRKPTANTQTVRLVLLDSTGSGNQVVADVPAGAAGAAVDAYMWIFITKRMDAAATNVYVRLQSRTSGTTVVDASFDRAYLVQGLMPFCGS